MSSLLPGSLYISAVRYQVVCRFICSSLACSFLACLLTNGLPLTTPPPTDTTRSFTKVAFRGPAPVRSSRTGRWPMKSVWTPWRTSSRKPGSSPRKPTRNTMRSLYGSLDVVWFGLSCLQFACNEYFIKMPSVASSWIITSLFFHIRSMCSSVYRKTAKFMCTSCGPVLNLLSHLLTCFFSFKITPVMFFNMKMTPNEPFVKFKIFPTKHWGVNFEVILTKPRKLTRVSLISCSLRHWVNSHEIQSDESRKRRIIASWLDTAMDLRPISLKK